MFLDGNILSELMGVTCKAVNKSTLDPAKAARILHNIHLVSLTPVSPSPPTSQPSHLAILFTDDASADDTSLIRTELAQRNAGIIDVQIGKPYCELTPNKYFLQILPTNVKTFVSKLARTFRNTIINDGFRLFFFCEIQQGEQYAFTCFAFFHFTKFRLEFLQPCHCFTNA